MLWAHNSWCKYIFICVCLSTGSWVCFVCSCVGYQIIVPVKKAHYVSGIQPNLKRRGRKYMGVFINWGLAPLYQLCKNFPSSLLSQKWVFDFMLQCKQSFIFIFILLRLYIRRGGLRFSGKRNSERCRRETYFLEKIYVHDLSQAKVKIIWFS